MAMLELSDIHTFYGNIEALKGISLTVEDGECVTLIGSNGAGKSTTLRSVSGLTPPRTGDIRFKGENITRTPPADIVKLGISQSPEGRRCFARMTVRENLDMGAYTQPRSSISSSLDQVVELFPILAERRDQRADTMSGGQQQMLAIGRALMARPRCLTLDEPSVGLAPNLAAQVLTAITRIRDAGVTILIVEQNAKQALAVSDRAYVLESGSIVLEGTGSELIDDDRVREAYLGV